MSVPEPLRSTSSQEPFKLPEEAEEGGSSVTIKASKPVPTTESEEVSERNAQTCSFLGNVIHELGISFKSIWNFISARIRTIRNAGSNFLVLIGVRSREGALIPPEENCEDEFSSHTREFPVIQVNEIIQALKVKDFFNVEGIFRVSGSKKDVDGYIKQLNRNEPVSFKEDVSIHTIAAALKGYIRDLRILETLPEARGKFLEAGNEEKSEAVRIQLLKDVLGSILDEHREVLESLVTLCQEIMNHEDVTKMNSKNLATCLVPNILGEGAIENALSEVKPSIAALKFLIENHDEIFMARAD